MADRACGKLQARVGFGEYRMNGLLISVTDAVEAEVALGTGVDILDMKNPAEGALGQLPLSIIAEIALMAANRCTTSATIGDLPMQPEILVKAVRQLAETGVDIIKIGFFGRQHHESCASAIAQAASAQVRLIAVLMADQSPDFNLLPLLKAAGFYGVMLDTANKQSGHLLDHLNLEELREFCGIAHEQKLVIGLAGSLREAHIPVLAELQANYLGFRGAVCVNSNRVAELDAGRLGSIKQMLHKYNRVQQYALIP